MPTRLLKASCRHLLHVIQGVRGRSCVRHPLQSHLIVMGPMCIVTPGRKTLTGPIMLILRS